MTEPLARLAAALAARYRSGGWFLRSRVQAMKIQYSEDTDTLYIGFRDYDVAETRDLDENPILDVDAEGNVLAITFEHASTRTDISRPTT